MCRAKEFTHKEVCIMCSPKEVTHDTMKLKINFFYKNLTQSKIELKGFVKN